MHLLCGYLPLWEFEGVRSPLLTYRSPLVGFTEHSNCCEHCLMKVKSSQSIRNCSWLAPITRPQPGLCEWPLGRPRSSAHRGKRSSFILNSSGDLWCFTPEVIRGKGEGLAGSAWFPSSALLITSSHLQSRSKSPHLLHFCCQLCSPSVLIALHAGLARPIW